MQLDLEKVRKIIDAALEEDIGSGDITSNLTIPEDATIKAEFITRENCVVSGIPVLEQIFLKQADKVKFNPTIIEGFEIKKGGSIFSVQGNARVILAYERVALNLLQYMCGIATLTRKFVHEIEHTKVKILDTRKTTPNLRVLAKYAVWIGGGKNHRFCLDDGILIKDNHIAFVGDISKAVELAKFSAPDGLKVEVECDNLDQVEKAIKAGADIILLDNMDIETLKKAVALNNGKCLLEASGGVNLQTVRAIAETGVDYISVGAITHSAPNIDIGLDIK
jgi:nicotinate-nucleotide pyrophosphorylase (carboxylating)